MPDEPSVLYDGNLTFGLSFFTKTFTIKLDYLGYKVWPLSAVNEMRKLTNRVKGELYKIKCPALIIHSTKDMLSLQSNIALVHDNISSEIKEIFLVNQANHNLFTNSPDQEIIFKKINSYFSQFRRN